jgi:hypothetical protein
MKWEYLTADYRRLACECTLVEFLNAQGKEGWELVEALGTGGEYRLIFKRHQQ